MTTGDLIVGGFIAIWILAAILVLVRNRRKGKNSCGCNCSGCSSANRAPNVVIEEESCCECCKKN